MAERIPVAMQRLTPEVVETMPLQSITSIERRSLMGHRTLRIHTSHDDVEFKTMDKATEELLHNAIEAGRGHKAAAPVTATSESPLAALKELALLRDSGIVSTAEFQAKKVELLAHL